MSLAAVVLAAGHARRFGADKLVRDFRGAPLVTHAIRAACAAPVDRVVVVKRPGAALDAACRDAAGDDARVQIIEIESDALSASLRAGLQAVEDASGVFVFLGDMPLIPHEITRHLAVNLGGLFAVVPTHEAAWGHPVLLSPRAMALTTNVRGDQGAGMLLREHVTEVAQVETEEQGVVLDVDTIEDLERLATR